MLKYFFAFILFIHALIHCTGFAKALGYGNITQIARNVSKPAGMVWLVTAILFILAVLLFLLKKESWSYIAVVAAIFSQVLIITVWRDAKFGTIANIIVLLVAITAWGSQHFESAFRSDVRMNLLKTNPIQTELLTEADIKSLPLPVQKYLRYCGAINKPKLHNMRVVFDGQMREKGKDWFVFESVQYNFFDEPARLFFMKAKMFGTTVAGYHNYQQAAARMDIKLFGLIISRLLPGWI